MKKHIPALLVFLAGLLPACWIGAGYLASNPVGALVAAVIIACYLVGGIELLRHRQATDALLLAVDHRSAKASDGGANEADLDGWLARLPVALQVPVRQRVDGGRMPLPGPMLTPYLVGLLVLLGMLGTLLGMMATLRGTGAALGGAADLAAVRGALGAPVEGLALAFGTSIAGVAASAMLGLLSALSRRHRALAVQRLDTAIAGPLHVHSQAWQRTETLRLLQQQSALIPTLVDRLEALAGTIQTQGERSGERLIASQGEFHQRTEASQIDLAQRLQQTLQQGVDATATAVGAALQPALERTMETVAAQSAVLNERVAVAVQQQLDALTSGFAGVADGAAQHWGNAVAQQQQANTALLDDLRGTLDGFSQAHHDRALALVDAAGTRETATQSAIASAFDAALQRQLTANADASALQQQALADAGQALHAHATSLLDAVQGSHAQLQSALADGDSARLQAWTRTIEELGTRNADGWQQVAEGDTARLRAWSRTVEELGTRNAEGWQQIAEGDAARLQTWSRTIEELGTRNADGWQQVAEGDAARLQAWSRTIEELGTRNAEGWQQVTEGDTARLQAWSRTIEELGTRAASGWERIADDVAARQQQTCAALDKAADEIATQSRAHATATIEEVSRLMQTAADAPRAAAEVIGGLRQQLSDSMARDTAMLDERARLLGTLQTLLDALGHASSEQREAIDALVARSAELMQQTGERLQRQVQDDAERLGGAAAQVTASAVEVASLGDAFGAAVTQFGSTAGDLGERLQQVATALDAAQTRSDEQLAYYVAQAREVVDLSVLSQKQIIEQLQQLGSADTSNADAGA